VHQVGNQYIVKSCIDVQGRLRTELFHGRIGTCFTEYNFGNFLN